MGESSFNPSYAIAYTIKFEILKVEMFTLNFCYIINVPNMIP